ncbi:acyl-CoA carboxylase subunit beta [Clostridium amazonitimonense]|uniref:acyl-CoA carboxylase subunit beta n=1 Tax=Clostridium amazonitimonense TaxID=1499689 RepID=UPI0005097178|nr:carboxyl transferase domain-containing protein [Clostridium amazonitimonense]
MDKLEDLIQKKQKIHFKKENESMNIQQQLKKLTARERIEFLLDEGSFVEIGGFVNLGQTTVITGFGTIDGRLIYLYAQDYNVKGGSIDLEGSKKICNIMDMTLKMGAPLVQILDSVGADLDEGINLFSAFGKIINMNSKLSGVVPQISVILGPCNGMSAISAAMSDFTIISEEKGSFYVSSPENIIEKEGQYVDYNMYAKGEESLRNGSIQLATKNEREALDLVKKIFSYLPSNNMELPIREENCHNNVCERLNNISKEDNKCIYEIIKKITDEGTIIEFDKDFSKEVVTALAKLNGITIGIVANNSKENNGYINKKAADKITKFVRLCNSFNISIVSLVDCKGFEANVNEEREGLALSVANMSYSLCEAVVPKVSLIIGKAFGAAYITLASKDSAFDLCYSWPNAEISLTKPESIIKIHNRPEILASENPKNKEEELVGKYYEDVIDPYKAAKVGMIDDMIIPSETKARIFMVLDMLQSKREIKYPKNHGNTFI